VKWIIIQTNLAHYPEDPDIEEYEAKDLDDLLKHMDDVERNDANITAVPLTKLATALGIVESDETQTVE